MKNLVLVLLIFSSVAVYGQRWTYSTGGNAFDGKYKTSKITGTGNKFPYRNPVMVVNLFEERSRPNVYFTDVGYAGCGGKKIHINFDDEDEVFHFYVSTNSDNDIWFINWDSYFENDLRILEFLDKLKKHSYVNVRLESDCGKNDLKFSLAGSTVAIDYVTKEWAKKEKIREKERKEQERLLKQQKEKELKEKQRKKRKKDSISQAVDAKLAVLQNQKEISFDSILKTINLAGYEMLNKYDRKKHKLKKTIMDENRLYTHYTDISPVKIVPKNKLLVIKDADHKNYFRVVNIENIGEVDYYISKKNVEDAFKEYDNIISEAKRKINIQKVNKIRQSFPTNKYTVMITSGSTNMYKEYTNYGVDLVLEDDVLFVIDKYKGHKDFYKVVYIDGIGQVDYFVSKVFVDPF